MFRASNIDSLLLLKISAKDILSAAIFMQCKTLFFEKNEKEYFKMSSGVIFTHYAEC